MFCQRVQYYDDDGNGNKYFNVDHIAVIDGNGCTNGEDGNLTTTDTLCFCESDGESAVTLSDVHKITGTLEILCQIPSCIRCAQILQAANKRPRNKAGGVKKIFVP